MSYVGIWNFRRTRSEFRLFPIEKVRICNTNRRLFFLNRISFDWIIACKPWDRGNPFVFRPISLTRIENLLPYWNVKCSHDRVTRMARYLFDLFDNSDLSNPLYYIFACKCTQTTYNVTERTRFFFQISTKRRWKECDELWTNTFQGTARDILPVINFTLTERILYIKWDKWIITMYVTWNKKIYEYS